MILAHRKLKAPPYNEYLNKYQREHLMRIRCDIQILYGQRDAYDIRAVSRVISLVDNLHTVLRRQAIFEFGKQVGTNSEEFYEPKFEGRELGSFELMNFYDGIAETRAGFQNPYRTVIGPKK